MTTPIEVVLRNLADKAGLLNQLRKCDTFAEMMVATALWRARDGWSVVTQGLFEEGYRVDIVIPEAMVCVEIDGEAWHGTEERRLADAKRQSAIMARGWVFVRPSASEAFLHSGDVAEAVVDMVRSVLARPLPIPEGDALAANVERITKAIANFEAHLAVVDPENAKVRTDNEARLSRLRLQLETLRDRQAMLGKDPTWEDEEAHLRRCYERARQRIGGST